MDHQQSILTDGHRQQGAKNLPADNGKVARKETGKIASAVSLALRRAQRREDIHWNRIGADVGDECSVDLSEGSQKDKGTSSGVPIVVKRGIEKVPQILRCQYVLQEQYGRRCKSYPVGRAVHGIPARSDDHAHENDDGLGDDESVHDRPRLAGVIGVSSEICDIDQWRDD